MRNNGSIDGIPVELMRHIFHYVLPPNPLLKPTCLRGAHSPWTRARADKTTMALVNWRWHSIVLPLLYEEAALRSPAQIRSFKAALRRKSSNLGRLVKTLVIDCPVEFADTLKLVIDNLIYIFARCTGLRTLIFTDALVILDHMFWFVEEIQGEDWDCIPTTLVNAIEGLSSTLVRFEHWPEDGVVPLGDYHFTCPLGPLSIIPLLATLAIHIDHPAVFERVAISSLEELDLSRSYFHSDRMDRSEHFASWKLPRLKRVVLPLLTNIQPRFLRRFGKRVTYLEFRDRSDHYTHSHFHPELQTPWNDCIPFCPILQHLVFRSDDLLDLDRLPGHPTLAYIDVWIRSPGGRARHDFVSARAQRTVASEVPWKNVRLLDRALYAIERLPELFPPDTPEAELPSAHTIPGLGITHTAWRVYRSDLDMLYPPAEEPWDEEPESGEWKYVYELPYNTLSEDSDDPNDG